MAVTTITINGRKRLSVLGNRVYAKLKWEDPWDLKADVHATNVSWSAAPDMPSASLYYRYGPRGGVNWGTALNPFSLPMLAYVKIEVDMYDPYDLSTKTATWYGVAGRLVDKREGVELNDGDPSPTYYPVGTQTIECVGMEWLLSRSYIDRSWVMVDGIPSLAEHGHTFNDRGRGNQDATLRTVVIHLAKSWTRQIPVFTSDPAATKLWSTKTIVQYLLAAAAPRLGSSDTDHPIQFKLRDTDTVLPTWDAPVVEAHGIAATTILNQLIARQRGMGYRYVVDTDDDDPTSQTVWLEPFTFTDTAITLPSGNTLPANSRQFAIDILDDQSGSIAEVTDAFSRYHTIRMVGRRVLSCFTVKLDATKQWTPAQEQVYKDAASGESNYPPASESDARHQMDVLRRNQADVHEVYRLFGLGHSWDRKDYAGNYAFPAQSIYGSGPVTALQDNSLITSLEMAAELPIYGSVDYTGLTDSGSIPDAIAGEPLLRPGVWIYSTEPDYRWIPGATLSEYSTSDRQGVHDWTASLIPRTDGPRFEIEVIGRPRHVLDGNAYSDTAYESPVDGPLGAFYLTDHMATIAVFCDQYCRVDVNSATSPQDARRTKVIQAGDDYQLNLLIKDTVVGVDPDGNLLKASATVYVRDDRPELEDIGNIALQWYGQDRRAIEFATRQIFQTVTDSATLGTVEFGVGAFITDLISATVPTTSVNTVVTQVTVDMPVSESHTVDASQMSVATSWAELDVMGVL